MKHYKIRNAVQEDLDGIIKLIQEFAEFEKLSDVCKVSEKDLHEAIFGTNKFADCLVAEVENKLVAYAILFPVFKTFRGERSMYLEDLYVLPEMREQGLGLKILKAVAEIAKEKNCVRLDWQALEWNKKAIDFYEKLGAKTDSGNVDFSLRGDDFLNLTNS